MAGRKRKAGSTARSSSSPTTSSERASSESTGKRTRITSSLERPAFTSLRAEKAVFPRRVLAGSGTVTANQMPSFCIDAATPCQLREEFEREGFLLLKGCLPRQTVQTARDAILDDMRARGFVKDMTLDGQALIKDPEAAGPGLLQRQDLATSNQSRTALEHPTLKRILNIVFASSSAGEDSGRGSHDTSPPADDRPVPLIAPHPYKWLRAVGPGGNTGPHVDRVYFPDLHTIWIPLGDVPTNLGSMIVARRSHKSPAFTTFQDAQSRKTLGKDGTHSGYATNDPNDIAELFDVQPRAALEWVTDDVEMGDVVVLHNRTLHMTATNTMEPPTWRISCDTRWFIDSPES